MFGNIYSGSKVFVTGHTGFKGSWLTAWLLDLGAQVCGFSNGIPTSPSNFEALNLHEKITDLRGDVRRLPEVKSGLLSFEPNVLFHLAAQPLVRESYENPVETFATNMLGVMNILEAARECASLKAIVIITSDKCYRNEEWVWGYKETDRLGGYDPYSASKGCAEIIAHSYFKSYFQNACSGVTVRAGNVIGGGDWAKDRIVPDCARAWAKREPVIIRSPEATRPWQHVLEPLSGYLWAGARLADNSIGGVDCFDPKGQAYNFGPPPDVTNSVADVVQALALHWPDFKSQIEKRDQDCKKESTLLKLCCDKALAELNWKATLDFEETLRFTADWYARFYAEQNTDMWDFTLGQIASYCFLARQRGLTWAK